MEESSPRVVEYLRVIVVSASRPHMACMHDVRKFFDMLPPPPRECPPT